MNAPDFRPRFKFESELTGTAIAERISARIRQDNPRRLWLKNAQYHLTLSFPGNASASWTPQMDINFEDMSSGRTMVRCLIGPAPGIWMLFVGGYVVLALLGLTGITLGTAQLMLGTTAWGLYALILVVPAVAFMIHLERLGRNRAKDDMHHLKQFVDHALGCDCLQLAHEQAA